MTDTLNPAKSNTDISVTYLGHASALIKLADRHILTDPNLKSRLGLARRRNHPGPAWNSLPRIDTVLISHAHLDHLDKFTLRKLPPSTPFLVPPGVGTIIKRMGFANVTELNSWQTISSNGVELTAVPAKHWGARFVFDIWRGYCGFVLKAEAGVVYFAGDTDYFSGFKEIGRRFSLDIALLPIGTYRPRLLLDRHHLNPEEAVRAFEDLNARYMVPIHWGTFRLSTEPLAEPLAWLKSLAKSNGLQDKILILQPGQTAEGKNLF